MNMVAYKAAEWWYEQLHAHSKRTANSFEDFNEMFTFLMSDKVPDEQLKDFEQYLYEDLCKLLIDHDSLSLTCTSYPCQILEDAGNKAGFLGTAFPWNTHMNIEDGVIRVKSSKGKNFRRLE